jgi:hypothetical protein
VSAAGKRAQGQATGSSTDQTCETSRTCSTRQRGLLGFGKMKDSDLDLNSEPFADIPDDEAAGDLEMLMREMGQARPPRAAPRRCPEGTDGASARRCMWSICLRCVYCCTGTAVCRCARRVWWW